MSQALTASKATADASAASPVRIVGTSRRAGGSAPRRSLTAVVGASGRDMRGPLDGHRRGLPWRSVLRSRPYGDDPVGDPAGAETVGNEQHRATFVGQRPDRAPQALLRLGVEGGAGLIEGEETRSATARIAQETVDGPRHGDALRLAAGQARSSHAEGRRRWDPVGAGEAERPPHQRLIGGGVAEGDVLGDAALQKTRVLPGPRQPRGRRELADCPSLPARRALGVGGSPKSREHAALPRPARARENSDGARRSLEVDGLEKRLAAPHPQASHDQTPALLPAGPRSIRSGRTLLPEPVLGGVEHIEDLLGRGDALRRRMELHPHLTQRQVRLGGEEEDEQAHGEGQRSVEEPEADRDRDDRHGDAGEELQGEPRQERHPQHRHRLAAIPRGGLGDGVDGALLALEEPQGAQPPHDVGETGREPAERVPLTLLHRAGRETDEHHEEGDEGEGQGDRHRRDPVLPPHHRDDQRGRDDGEHQLRQIAPEVRLQRLEPAAGRHRQARGIAPGQPAGAQAIDGREDGLPQLRLRTRGRARRRGLSRPGEAGAQGDDGREGGEDPRELGRRHPVDRADDRPREQPGEGDDHERLREPDENEECEERAGGRGVAQQPRIDGTSHEGCSVGGRGGRGLDVPTSDALAEHPVGPALIGQHERKEDQGRPRHDREGVVGARGVLDRQREGRIGRGGHHVREEREPQCEHGARDGGHPEGEGAALAVAGARDHAAGDAHRGDAGGDEGGGEGGGAAGPGVGERPGEEHRGDRQRDETGPDGESAGPRVHRPVGLQRHEGHAVGEEQQQGRRAAQERVGVQQVEQRAGELEVLIDRHAADDVGHRDTPEERRDGRTDHDHQVEAPLPAEVVALVAVLERHPADDEGQEDQQERQVEAAEERRVPLGESGEQARSGDDHPGLVEVPHRPDGVDDLAAGGLIAAEERQRHPDTEVEAVEDEVAEEEETDDPEPQGGKIHDAPFA